MTIDNQIPHLSILVVDDEPNIRKTLSYCLAAEGHTVITVSNPADATEEARGEGGQVPFWPTCLTCSLTQRETLSQDKTPNYLVDLCSKMIDKNGGGRTIAPG